MSAINYIGSEYYYDKNSSRGNDIVYLPRDEHTPAGGVFSHRVRHRHQPFRDLIKNRGKGYVAAVRLYSVRTSCKDAVACQEPHKSVSCAVTNFSAPQRCSPYPSSMKVRIDSAVKTRSVGGIHYYLMLVKIIAWVSDRVTAVHILGDALRCSRVRNVMTNSNVLRRILDDTDSIAI